MSLESERETECIAKYSNGKVASGLEIMSE